MSNTPDKIRESIDHVDLDIKEIEELSNQIEDLSKNIFRASSRLMTRFDEVPVDRLRKIKPLIESVQSNVDVLIESASSIEEFRKISSDLKESSNELRRYFEDVYMSSVLSRQQRDR